jgi:hypothetical protein
MLNEIVNTVTMAGICKMTPAIQVVYFGQAFHFASQRFLSCGPHAAPRAFAKARFAPFRIQPSATAARPRAS